MEAINLGCSQEVLGLTLKEVFQVGSLRMKNMQELISIAQDNQYNQKKDAHNNLIIDLILNKRIG